MEGTPGMKILESKDHSDWRNRDLQQKLEMLAQQHLAPATAKKEEEEATATLDTFFKARHDDALIPPPPPHRSAGKWMQPLGRV